MRAPARADEILSAARALMDAAVSEPSARTRFDLRVGSRLLALLQRELAQGGAAEAAEREGLLALLPDAGADADTEDLRERLCERLGAGDLRAQDAELRAHLWSSTLAQLAIDSPTYAWHTDHKSRS